MTGYSEQEAVGKKCVMFAESPCKERCGVFSAEVSKPMVARECVIRRKDGEERLIRKNADLLTDPEGNVVGAIESFEDITDMRVTTQRLAQWADDLQTVHETALALNAVRDLEDLLRQTLRGLHRVTAANRARVMVLDRDGGDFAMRAELDEAGTLHVMPDDHTPGSLSRAILDGKEARFV